MTERAQHDSAILDIAEPLDVSAPIAREAAARFCRYDSLSGTTCAWYHGFWQYVRLVGLGASPSVHARQLVPTLQSLAKAGTFERILISGSADYSMLAHVLAAYARELAAVRPVVVDICDTPLYMCRWYAARMAANVETEASDIRSFVADLPFDAIVTHAFLGYFSPPERERLVSKWATLLRPGGRLVTIQRIRARAPGGVVRFTPHEKEAFVAKMRGAAQNSATLDYSSRTWLAAAAQDYADRFWTHPVCSTDELVRLFEDASLSVEVLETSVADEHATGRASGPTIPTNAEYAFLVAARR